MEDVPNLTGTRLIEIGIVWYVSKNRIGIHFRHKKQLENVIVVPNLTGTRLIKTGIVWYVSKNRI